MRLKLFALTVAVLVFGTPALSQEACTLTVRTQKEFDAMPTWLVKALDNGSIDIKVVIKGGTYRYKDLFINFSDKISDADIEIVGEDAVLMAAEGKADVNAAFIDIESLAPLNLWRGYEQPGCLVEVLDKGTKACRIKTSLPDRQEKDCMGMYILIPQWYKSEKYEVDRIKSGYIYFKATDLKMVSGGWSVNYDYIYGKVYPRYRLFEPRVPAGTAVCAAVNFLCCDRTKFHSLKVRGISFVGNGASTWLSLFRLNNTETSSIQISSCNFTGLNSVAIGINNTGNVSVDSNVFKYDYDYCVKAQNSTYNVKVTNNIFENIGMMKNLSCVECKGEGYLISGNRIKNFCYFGISLGEWYKSLKTGPSSGMVNGNELWYDEAYIADKENNTLMDSGAIYLYTQNDGAVIKGNSIHDYTGMCDNRGIFCDDGAYGFTITGNYICRIFNSYCIDSRLCLKVESESGSVVSRVNVNNTVKHNKTDGRVRFERRP